MSVSISQASKRPFRQPSFRLALNPVPCFNLSSEQATFPTTMKLSVKLTPSSVSISQASKRPFQHCYYLLNHDLTSCFNLSSEQATFPTRTLQIFISIIR